jgi:hypothetical protein
MRWVRNTSAVLEAFAYALAAKLLLLSPRGKVWVTLLMDHKQAQRHVQYKNHICITICD